MFHVRLPNKSLIMIVVPLLIWYTRREDSFSIRDLNRGAALLLALMFFVAGDGFASSCCAEQPGRADHLLREGTRVPSVTGRIAMLGRRWVFVPDQIQTEQGDTVARSAGVRRAYLVTDRSDWRPNQRATRLGTGRQTGTRGQISTQSEMDSQGEIRSNRPEQLKSFRVAAGPIANIGGQSELPFEQILLHENLMLQRIVEAIRADANDDRWTISGRVTEFFNENRLTIELAQRANRR